MFNKVFYRKIVNPALTIDYIVVGLGNPGREYELTRHNAGFLACEYLAQKLSAQINKIKFKSSFTLCKIGDKRVMLLKPSTFMNNSGEAIREAMQFYKIPIEHVLVIYDDVSLDCGSMRIRRKGSDGGHNGIKSIIYLTNSDNFPRIKIGVGKKPSIEFPLADWVLSRFSKSDITALEKLFPLVYEAVNLIVCGEIEAAMNKFN